MMCKCGYNGSTGEVITLCGAHASYLRAELKHEREACAEIALAIESDGHPELFGDPDVPTPITRAIRARK